MKTFIKALVIALTMTATVHAETTMNIDPAWQKQDLVTCKTYAAMKQYVYTTNFRQGDCVHGTPSKQVVVLEHDDIVAKVKFQSTDGSLNNVPPLFVISTSVQNLE